MVVISYHNHILPISSNHTNRHETSYSRVKSSHSIVLLQVPHNHGFALLPHLAHS
jgi:hypothetical protein